MKVLHLVQFLGIGGLEKVLQLLIKEQMAIGHEVELCVYDHNQDWVDEFRANGIKVTTEYMKKPGYDFGLVKFLENKVSGYDLVHTHDLNPMMYLGPVKILNWLRDQRQFPKIVHTTHGMEHIDLEPRTILYERFIASMTDAVIGVSPAICQYYEKKLKVNPTKIFNIDNGTPVPESLPIYREGREQLITRFNLDRDKPILSTVARVVPLKDQKLLIQAMKDFPELQLIVVGPSGNDQYYEELKQIKTDNVHLVGAQSRIDEILRGSDLFVSASHHEGIPISVLEAQAQGLPCILSDIPGHSGFEALFFPIKSDCDYRDAIRKFFTSDFNIDNLRRNGHSMVKNEYSSQAMARNYERVYQC